MMKPETSQELRGLVREVLRETLANRTPATSGVETINIASEAAFQTFVSRLASPGVIEAVRSGKLRFTLGQAEMASVPMPTTSDALEGVVNERRVDSCIVKGIVLLGATAVLTPLARDRVRKLGLKIERSR